MSESIKLMFKNYFRDNMLRSHIYNQGGRQYIGIFDNNRIKIYQHGGDVERYIKSRIKVILDKHKVTSHTPEQALDIIKTKHKPSYSNEFIIDMLDRALNGHPFARRPGYYPYHRSYLGYAPPFHPVHHARRYPSYNLGLRYLGGGSKESKEAKDERKGGADGGRMILGYPAPYGPINDSRRRFPTFSGFWGFSDIFRYPFTSPFFRDLDAEVDEKLEKLLKEAGII